MYRGFGKTLLAFFMALLLIPSFASAAPFERPLSLGTSGPDVSALQTILKEKGFFNTDITGFYGPVTLQAVANFQRSVGLDHLGYVGPATRAILNGEVISSSTNTVAAGPSTSSVLSVLVSQLQQLLRNAGYFQVEISGSMDASTRAAAQAISTDTNSTDAPKRSGGSRNSDSEEIVVSNPPVAIALSVPTGFTWTPDFTIYNTDGEYSTDFDIDAYKPNYTRTVYVGPGGNNLSDGLSYENRVRSLSAGITKANTYTGETVRLLADPADYHYNELHDGFRDSWNNVSPTVDMVVEASGVGAVSSKNTAAFSVATTSDPNIFVIIGAENISRHVIDAKYTTDGFPELSYVVLSAASSTNPIAELNTAWATYGTASYREATNGMRVWVRLSDNRQPDADISVFRAQVNGLLSSASASRILWMSDVTFWGGESFRVVGGTSGNIPKVYGKNMSYAYSQQGGTNGFAWTSGAGEAYLVDSGAMWNNSDGFNYRGTVKAFELNTIANHNGWNSNGTNNGSTGHDSAKIIRLNTSYANNQDRNVHDISSVESWNIGVTSGPSRSLSGEGSANFAAGIASTSQVTKLWLDGAVSADGSAFDLQAYDGTTIYVANTDTSGFTNVTSGTPAGIITTYTP